MSESTYEQEVDRIERPGERRSRFVVHVEVAAVDHDHARALVGDAMEMFGERCRISDVRRVLR